MFTKPTLAKCRTFNQATSYAAGDQIEENKITNLKRNMTISAMYLKVFLQCTIN